MEEEEEGEMGGEGREEKKRSSRRMIGSGWGREVYCSVVQCSVVQCTKACPSAGLPCRVLVSAAVDIRAGAGAGAGAGPTGLP